MKAQKAAGKTVVSILACAGLVSLFGEAAAFDTEDMNGFTAISVDTVIVAEDGSFTASVRLDKLPDSGLNALEFAIAYDPAVLSISKVELLYDTGAQNAEDFAKLEMPVFTYEDLDGRLWIRWGTGLVNADYWLTKEQAFLTVSGTLSDQIPAGGSTELRIVPAAGETAQAEIAAGYVDADGKTHYCKTTVQNGAVWRPIDETGATMYGDVNLDGQRTVSDAVLMHRAVAEEISLNAAAYANADCEFDGQLTIADVMLMLRFLDRGIKADALGARENSGK